MHTEPDRRSIDRAECHPRPPAQLARSPMVLEAKRPEEMSPRSLEGERRAKLRSFARGHERDHSCTRSGRAVVLGAQDLSLIHISEPTRPY